jgi:hypothetical protein
MGNSSGKHIIIIDRKYVGETNIFNLKQTLFNVDYQDKTEFNVTRDRLISAPSTIKNLPNPLSYKILQPGQRVWVDRNTKVFPIIGGHFGYIIKIRSGGSDESYDVELPYHGACQPGNPTGTVILERVPRSRLTERPK